MSQKLEDIRYLTVNFGDLQGLRWIPLGIWLILLGLDDYGWPPLETLAGSTPFASMLLLLLLVVLYGFIGLYYESSFGDVIRFSKSTREKLTNTGLFLLFLLVSYLDGALDTPVNLTLLYIGVVLFLYHYLKGIRWHGSVLVALAIIVYALSALWANGSPPAAPYHIFCGTISIISGILLHFQLLRRLRTIQQNLAGNG